MKMTLLTPPSDSGNDGLFYVLGRGFSTMNAALVHASYLQLFERKWFSIPIYRNGEIARLKRF